MKIGKKYYSLFLAALAGIIFCTTATAQPTSLTKDEMLFYTSVWKGERFPDGRPKVSDDLIKRIKYVSVTEAWATLNGSGDQVEGQAATGFGGGRGATYTNQYYGGFKMMREELVISGRASTIHFMPFRPDLNNLIQQQGTKDGRGRGQYTWGIDQLQNGDCYVANVCEAELDASHVGDNLGTTIWTKTGNGAVIKGTLRDLYGNLAVNPNWNVMVRDFRPQANSSNLVIGVNCPLQVGYVTVMPGDVVLGTREGVVFIPPQFVQRVVESSEKTRMQDYWAHQGVKEGRFTAQQADGSYTPEMNKEFTQWLITNADNMKKFLGDAAPSPEFIKEYAKSRQNPPQRPATAPAQQ